MAVPVKRLHYFDHQFLRAKDFTDEQEYHLEMRRLHNRTRHTWGIVQGLTLSAPVGASRVTVGAGIAVDGEGREMVLPADVQTQDLSGFAGKTVFVTMSYREQESDATDETGATGNTRWTEAPFVEANPNPPDDPSEELVLGRVTLAEDGTTAGAPDSGEEPYTRRAAGVVGGDLQVNSLSLADPDVVSTQWPRLYLGKDGAVVRAELQSNLMVHGDITATGKVNTRDIGADGTKLDAHVADKGNPHVTTAAQIDATGGSNRIVTQINAGSGTISAAHVDAAIARDSEVSARFNVNSGHNHDGVNSRRMNAGDVGALPVSGGTLSGNLQVNGRIGIGVTALDNLDINGDVRVRGQDIKDSGGTPRITIVDNGDLDLKSHSGSIAVAVNTDSRIAVGRVASTDRLSKLTVTGFNVVRGGTVDVTAGSNSVVGTGTSFLSEVGIGDGIYVYGGSQSAIVTAITSDTQLTVDSNFSSTATGSKWVDYSSLFRADSYGGSPLFLISHTGNVGIGTITPGADKLQVQGRCYSSGGWQTTNADYAEYFESASGKAIPVGTSVVLSREGKVRAAKKNETPIGIVTEHSAIVGNSYKEWPQKYLRDKFGRQVMEKVKEPLMVPKRETVTKERQKTKKEVVTEQVRRQQIVVERGKYVRREKTEAVSREVEVPLFEEVDLYDEKGTAVIGKHQVPIMESYEEEVEVLDETGNPVLVNSGTSITVERPKLNPQYDETKAYIPREDRPEWISVGLLGQLALKKGLPVAPTWVKVKELAEDVELWLVK